MADKPPPYTPYPQPPPQQGGGYPPPGVYPPGAYSQGPYPAGAAAPPPVQQAKPKKRTGGGMFGFLNEIGDCIERGLEQASDGINRGLDQASDDIRASQNITPVATSMLNLFQTNNVLQLISRASGRSVQIVQSPTGQLVVDGGGGDGPQFMNAHWTVINEGNNIIKLHNNFNFLVIVNGVTQIVNFPPNSPQGNETRLRVYQIGQFVTLESVQEPKRHLGILPDGTLKAALATGKEDHGQFGVKLIYTPYAQPAQNVQSGNVVYKK